MSGKFNRNFWIAILVIFVLYGLFTRNWQDAWIIFAIGAAVWGILQATGRGKYKS